ncbi:MAG: tRNA pseudouridine(38-40) synthase TruA [Psychroflexus sp.]|nr:tRNA pseudouridine(38-40) synthase TruA [Psychroflexus sp.]MDR9448518.1 tRNA pseudouridine(38-40) synthase TruA [Psychroflexus sp.]
MSHIVRYNYLIEIQFLGFRYHGWQQQPGVITLEKMVRKTLNYVLGNRRKKVVSAGRTDAMVSAFSTFIELFVEQEALDQPSFFLDFNKNLPPDIRALSICQVDDNFNIIQHPKEKEYIYLFSFPVKNHPFCAPFMTNIQEKLDLELMTKAAKFFEGQHDFRAFIHLPQSDTKTIVDIKKAEVIYNDLFQLPIFPEESYAFIVRGKGFKRQQIRLMMGALIEIGIGKFTIDQLDYYLKYPATSNFTYIAPASGLFLNRIKFNQLEEHIIT